MNLSEFSIENLKKFQKVLKIVLDELELQGINRLVGIKIPLKKFEKEGLDYDTVRIVLYKTNKGNDIMRVENEYLKQRYEELVDEHGHPQNRQDRLISEAVVGVSEEDLKNYVILRAKNLNIVNKLKEIKEGIEEELKKRTKTYVKEIKRRFEEMNEKQEERETLKKEINSKKPLVISDAIIAGLFNEPNFIKLTSKKGCKFSISAYLNEKWLLSDNVLWSVPDCFDIKNDEEGALDLIDDLVKKELNKLEKLKWIKIAKCDGPIEIIIPEESEQVTRGGYFYDMMAEWVVWSKFLHYVADEHDKKVLDWDNIFAPQKQKRLLIKFIDEKRTDLEKDTNIILAPKYQGLMRQIRFLDTLELLEKEGLIAINGIKVCDPVCDIGGVRSFYVPLPIIYFRLKADVSLTDKFQKAVKEIKGTVDEKPKRINKEVIKQLEEMNEKQEEKEALKKEILAEIQDKKAIKKQRVKKAVLYLNQNGDLYREPKDKYCYPMGQKSNRHRIIRFLATNKGYQLTEFISTELEIESEKSIRTEIGKMRNNIKKYLKIKSKDFLQGKKESGYRINPEYKVIPKNE